LFLFSLRVNTPLRAALLLEISFVEIPRSLLRGVPFEEFPFYIYVTGELFIWKGNIYNFGTLKSQSKSMFFY